MSIFVTLVGGFLAVYTQIDNKVDTVFRNLPFLGSSDCLVHSKLESGTIGTENFKDQSILRDNIQQNIVKQSILSDNKKRK